MKRLSTRALQGSVSAGGTGLTEAFEARPRRLLPRVRRRGALGRRPGRRGAIEPRRADRRRSRRGRVAHPIVQPDRPFCALEDDWYTFEVSARKGSGRFAAEVWVLRASSARNEGPGKEREAP